MDEKRKSPPYLIVDNSKPLIRSLGSANFNLTINASLDQKLSGVTAFLVLYRLSSWSPLCNCKLIICANHLLLKFLEQVSTSAKPWPVSSLQLLQSSALAPPWQGRASPPLSASPPYPSRYALSYTQHWNWIRVWWAAWFSFVGFGRFLSCKFWDWEHRLVILEVHSSLFNLFRSYFIVNGNFALQIWCLSHLRCCRRHPGMLFTRHWKLIGFLWDHYQLSSLGFRSCRFVLLIENSVVWYTGLVSVTCVPFSKSSSDFCGGASEDAHWVWHLGYKMGC